MNDYLSAAKIGVTEDELAWINEKAGELITGFAALDEIDTADVPPLVSVLPVMNVMREDIAVKTVPRDELLAAAPRAADGYYKAPRLV